MVDQRSQIPTETAASVYVQRVSTRDYPPHPQESTNHISRRNKETIFESPQDPYDGTIISPISTASFGVSSVKPPMPPKPTTPPTRIFKAEEVIYTPPTDLSTGLSQT
mmetsp:Transcript_1976/g.2713  ORF Transcript_1976/g.2713 Transcript_1976/m.2713 type:complete len:108 (-) Transcript_1976:441-764(-)